MFWPIGVDWTWASFVQAIIQAQGPLCDTLAEQIWDSECPESELQAAEPGTNNRNDGPF